MVSLAKEIFCWPILYVGRKGVNDDVVSIHFLWPLFHMLRGPTLIVNAILWQFIRHEHNRETGVSTFHILPLFFFKWDREGLRSALILPFIWFDRGSSRESWTLVLLPFLFVRRSPERTTVLLPFFFVSRSHTGSGFTFHIWPFFGISQTPGRNLTLSTLFPVVILRWDFSPADVTRRRVFFFYPLGYVDLDPASEVTHVRVLPLLWVYRNARDNVQRGFVALAGVWTGERTRTWVLVPVFLWTTSRSGGPERRFLCLLAYYRRTADRVVTAAVPLVVFMRKNPMTDVDVTAALWALNVRVRSFELDWYLPIPVYLRLKTERLRAVGFALVFWKWEWPAESIRGWFFFFLVREWRDGRPIRLAIVPLIGYFTDPEGQGTRYDAFYPFIHWGRGPEGAPRRTLRILPLLWYSWTPEFEFKYILLYMSWSRRKYADLSASAGTAVPMQERSGPRGWGDRDNDVDDVVDGEGRDGSGGLGRQRKPESDCFVEFFDADEPERTDGATPRDTASDSSVDAERPGAVSSIPALHSGSANANAVPARIPSQNAWGISHDVEAGRPSPHHGIHGGDGKTRSRNYDNGNGNGDGNGDGGAGPVPADAGGPVSLGNVVYERNVKVLVPLYLSYTPADGSTFSYLSLLYVLPPYTWWAAGKLDIFPILSWRRGTSLTVLLGLVYKRTIDEDGGVYKRFLIFYSEASGAFGILLLYRHTAKVDRFLFLWWFEREPEHWNFSMFWIWPYSPADSPEFHAALVRVYTPSTDHTKHLSYIMPLFYHSPTTFAVGWALDPYIAMVRTTTRIAEGFSEFAILFVYMSTTIESRARQATGVLPPAAGAAGAAGASARRGAQSAPSALANIAGASGISAAVARREGTRVTLLWIWSHVGAIHYDSARSLFFIFPFLYIDRDLGRYSLGWLFSPVVAIARHDSMDHATHLWPIAWKKKHLTSDARHAAREMMGAIRTGFNAARESSGDPASAMASTAAAMRNARRQALVTSKTSFGVLWLIPYYPISMALYWRDGAYTHILPLFWSSMSSQNKRRIGILFFIIYMVLDPSGFDFRLVFRFFRIANLESGESSHFEVNPFIYYSNNSRKRRFMVLGGLVGLTTDLVTERNAFRMFWVCEC